MSYEKKIFKKNHYYFFFFFLSKKGEMGREPCLVSLSSDFAALPPMEDEEDEDEETESSFECRCFDMDFFDMIAPKMFVSVAIPPKPTESNCIDPLMVSNGVQRCPNWVATVC